MWEWLERHFTPRGPDARYQALPLGGQRVARLSPLGSANAQNRRLFDLNYMRSWEGFVELRVVSQQGESEKLEYQNRFAIVVRVETVEVWKVLVGIECEERMLAGRIRSLCEAVRAKWPGTAADIQVYLRELQAAESSLPETGNEPVLASEPKVARLGRKPGLAQALAHLSAADITATYADMVAEYSSEGGRRPSQKELAQRLKTDRSTLRRRMLDQLGMSWPPPV